MRLFTFIGFSIILFIFFFSSTVIFASSETDFLKSLQDIVPAYGSEGWLGLGMALTGIATKFLKTKWCRQMFPTKYRKKKRFVVAGLGTVIGTLTAMGTGVGVVPAILTSVFGSSGVYEQIKPWFKKAKTLLT